VSRGKFHQQKKFTLPFFADILAPKKFKPKTQLCNFLAPKYWHQNIGTKCVHKMLMKLTPGVNFTNLFTCSQGT